LWRPQYNRRLRKTIHILAGLPSFAFKFLPYWAQVSLAFGLLLFSLLLSPRLKFISALAKPEDRERGYIAGVRHYFLTVFLLVLIFGYLKASFVGLAGWLALAWGDGAAGLVGRRDSAKLPWSRRKTIVGFFSCIIFTFLAILITYVWLFWEAGFGALLRPSLLAMFGATAFLVAIMESIDLPIDDNYVVGLGTAFLLFFLFLFLFPPPI